MLFTRIEGALQMCSCTFSPYSGVHWPTGGGAWLAASYGEGGGAGPWHHLHSGRTRDKTKLKATLHRSRFFLQMNSVYLYTFVYLCVCVCSSLWHWCCRPRCLSSFSTGNSFEQTLSWAWLHRSHTGSLDQVFQTSDTDPILGQVSPTFWPLRATKRQQKSGGELLILWGTLYNNVI